MLGLMKKWFLVALGITMIIMVMPSASSVAAQGTNDVGADIVSKLKLTTETPLASPKDGWINSYFMGNGDLGVSIGGSADNLRFYISKNGFFGYIQNQGRPDWNNDLTHNYMSLGGQDISIPQLQGASFHQEMDMYNAQINGSYVKGNYSIKMSSNVDSNNNYLITTITNNGSQAVNVSARNWVKSAVSGYDFFLKPLPMQITPATAGVDGDTAYVTRKTPACTDVGCWQNAAAMATKVIGATSTISVNQNDSIYLGGGQDSTQSTDPARSATNTFGLAPNQTATVITYVNSWDNWEQIRKSVYDSYKTSASYVTDDMISKSPTYGMDDVGPLAVSNIHAVTSSIIQTNLQNHYAWWHNYWSLSTISIPSEPLIEKYWYTNNYLMGANSRDGKYAPGMYGLMPQTDYAMWWGVYAMNYNYQTPFAGMLSSNRLDLMKSYFKTTTDMIPSSRKVAADEGAQGAHFKGGMTPAATQWSNVGDLGMHTDDLESMMNFLSYYKYTKDAQWLRDKAYPVMQELAQYWDNSQWLTKQNLTSAFEYKLSDALKNTFSDWGPLTQPTLSLANNALHGEITNSPYVSTILSADNLNLSNAKQIKVTMKKNVASSQINFFYVKNGQDSSFNGPWGQQSKSVSIPATTNAYFDVTIDFSTIAGWDGTLKRFRIDPISDAYAAVGSNFDIQNVKVLDASGNTLKEWNYNQNIAPTSNIQVSLKNSSAYTTAALYFTTTASQNYSEDKKLAFTITPNDSDFKTYNLNMSSFGNVPGSLDKVKIKIVGDSGSFIVNNLKAGSSYNADLPQNPNSITNKTYQYNLTSALCEKCYDHYLNNSEPLGFVKYFYQSMIEFSQLLGKDQDKLAKWQDIYNNLAEFPYTVMNGTEYMSFTGGDNYLVGGGYPIIATLLYPYNFELTNPASNTRYRQAIKNTIQYNLANNISDLWNQGNDFQLIYPVAIRLGFDPQTVMDRFKTRLTQNMHENGVVFQEGGGIETWSGVEYVNSMFLQSDMGVISIFPNWIRSKDASFTTLRAPGAFLVSSRIINAQIPDVDITSLAGGTVQVKSPWDGTVKVTDSSGNPVTVQNQNGILSFNTLQGMKYTLAPLIPVSQTRFEAENAALSGGASVNTNHPGYSGTGFVDGYGNSSTAKTAFTVNAGAAGNYKVTLRYSAGNSTSTNMGLYVNNVKLKNLTLPSTGNWDTWASAAETVALNSGINTIDIRAESATLNCINIDYIDVNASTPLIMKYEAESATKLGRARNNQDSAASGGYSVADLDQSGDGIQFSGVAAGTKLTVQYCSIFSGTYSVYVNGTRAAALSFTSNGVWSGAYASASVNVTIPANATVKLQKDSGDSALNIDYISVQ